MSQNNPCFFRKHFGYFLIVTTNPCNKNIASVCPQGGWVWAHLSRATCLGCSCFLDWIFKYSLSLGFDSERALKLSSFLSVEAMCDCRWTFLHGHSRWRDTRGFLILSCLWSHYCLKRRHGGGQSLMPHFSPSTATVHRTSASKTIGAMF